MKIITVMLIILLTSCHNKAVESRRSNNDKITVELLFEVDGCKVYRFWDSGYKYFTNCRGGTTWDETHSNGKSSYKENYSIQTDR